MPAIIGEEHQGARGESIRWEKESIGASARGCSSLSSTYGKVRGGGKGAECLKSAPESTPHRNTGKTPKLRPRA